MSINVILAVEHPIMRLGLVNLIGSDNRIVVSAQAEDAYSLDRALRDTDVSVVLVDCAIVRSEGVEAFRKIVQAHPERRFLFLALDSKACHSTLADLAPVVDAGNRGAILTAIRAAETCGGQVAGAPNNPNSPGVALTRRETEILVLVAHGLSSVEIAEQLSISKRTVELHRYRISRKLGLRTPLDLVKYAVREGLIHLHD